MSESTTERSDPEGRDLDTLATPELVARLIAHQQRAVDAVAAAHEALARASEVIAESFARGGTLHYVGAGTSGRLGALDAAELPPTFGVDPLRARAHLAGGERALTRAIENAEDDAMAAADAMRAAVRAGDVVVAISASGRTPFALAALDEANARGARTIAVTSDATAPLAERSEVAIVVATGAETIAGSTRMTAGTAQKMVLSILSTTAMVRLGHVYEDAMVDIRATNAKLRRRAVGLVRRFTNLDDETARALLARADGHVKVAIVMARLRIEPEAARAALEEARGQMRRVLADAR